MSSKRTANAMTPTSEGRPFELKESHQRCHCCWYTFVPGDFRDICSFCNKAHCQVCCPIDEGFPCQCCPEGQRVGKVRAYEGWHGEAQAGWIRASAGLLLRDAKYHWEVYRMPEEREGWLEAQGLPLDTRMTKIRRREKKIG